MTVTIDTERNFIGQKLNRLDHFLRDFLEYSVGGWNIVGTFVPTGKNAFENDWSKSDERVDKMLFAKSPTLDTEIEMPYIIVHLELGSCNYWDSAYENTVTKIDLNPTMEEINSLSHKFISLQFYLETASLWKNYMQSNA